MVRSSIPALLVGALLGHGLAARAGAQSPHGQGPRAHLLDRQRAARELPDLPDRAWEYDFSRGETRRRGTGGWFVPHLDTPPFSNHSQGLCQDPNAGRATCNGMVLLVLDWYRDVVVPVRNQGRTVDGYLFHRGPITPETLDDAHRLRRATTEAPGRIDAARRAVFGQCAAPLIAEHTALHPRGPRPWGRGHPHPWLVRRWLGWLHDRTRALVPLYFRFRDSRGNPGAHIVLGYKAYDGTAVIRDADGAVVAEEPALRIPFYDPNMVFTARNRGELFRTCSLLYLRESERFSFTRAYREQWRQGSGTQIQEGTFLDAEQLGHFPYHDAGARRDMDAFLADPENDPTDLPQARGLPADDQHPFFWDDRTHFY